MPTETNATADPVTYVDEIRSKILRRCDVHWDATKRAYLLSQLGQDLGPDLLTIKHNTGKNLLEFLEHELSSELKLVRDPNSPNVRGVIPMGAQLAEDLRQYFSASSTKLEPRYLPSFWAAFSKPLAPTHRRVIRLGDRIRFDDLEDGIEPPPDGKRGVGRPHSLNGRARSA